MNTDVLPELRVRGSCNGVGPEVFFPENEKDLQLIGEALSYCSGCPVLQQCFDHAMESEEFGIWGGTTARQRRSIKRKAKALATKEKK